MKVSMLMEEICQAIAEYDVEDAIYELESLGIAVRNNDEERTYKDIREVFEDIIATYGE